MSSTRRASAALAVAAFLATALVAPAAQANRVCQIVPQGRLCTAQVDFQRFSQSAYMNQAMSQWCWAASISMIYAYYGHPVGQPRIVTEVYGTIANIPAMAGITIAQQLNRAWIDDRGAAFTSQLTGAYDPQFGVRAIGNVQIVDELSNERPLVIGARTHAMVLTMVQYLDQPTGPYVVSAGVFDPWPGNGARLLEPDELTPLESGGSLRFLASIRVTESSGPTGYDAGVTVDPGGWPPRTTTPYRAGCNVAGPPSTLRGSTIGLLALAALACARRRRAAP